MGSIFGVGKSVLLSDARLEKQQKSSPLPIPDAQETKAEEEEET